MTAQQMSVVLFTAGGVLLIVSFAIELGGLIYPALPFFVGSVYCTYRTDWDDS